MREIARREGLRYTSTVMRGIRAHEDRLDRPPPPPAAILRAAWRRMPNVIALYRRGLLSADQARLAERFRRDPEAWRPLLPPAQWQALHDIIVASVPLQEIEAARGWAPRSAKTVLRVILDGLLEGPAEPRPPRSTAASRELEELREMVAYLTADDVALELGERQALTPMSARLLTVLRRAPGRLMSREHLLTRLYGTRAADDWPAAKVIDVYVCRIRAHLSNEGTGETIETVWGVGFRLLAGAPAEVVE